jgi:hypothetical protein
MVIGIELDASSTKVWAQLDAAKQSFATLIVPNLLLDLFPRWDTYRNRSTNGISAPTASQIHVLSLVFRTSALAAPIDANLRPSRIAGSSTATQNTCANASASAA